MEYLIIIFTNLVLYYRTIFFGEVVDDIRLRRGHRKNNRFTKWSLGHIKYKLYGAGMFESLKLDHAFTVLLHTLICTLIYIAFGRTYVSFLGAMLYAIAPTNNQTAIWMNGRRYAVNTILVLLMWLFKPLGFLLYPLVFLFQANAVPAIILCPQAIPILLLVCSLLFLNKKFKQQSIYTAFKQRFGNLIQTSEYSIIAPRKLILSVKSYGYFFFHTIFPFKVSFYNSMFEDYAVTKTGTIKAYSLNYMFWKGILALIISICSYIYIPEIRFYLFWYVIFISPWLNFFTMTQICADRYTAIANIGLLLAIAHILSGYPILLGLLMGFYIAQNLRVQGMYKDIDSFYLYQIWEEPGAVLNICYYITAAIEQGYYFQAMTAVMRGLQVNPKDYRLLLTKARLLHKMGYRRERDNVVKECYEVVDDQIFMSREKIEIELNKLK